MEDELRSVNDAILELIQEKDFYDNKSDFEYRKCEIEKVYCMQYIINSSNIQEVFKIMTTHLRPPVSFFIEIFP